MASEVSEECMTYKLLIDGEGTGDDRRLMLFLQKCKAWLESTDASPEYNEKMFDSLTRQVEPLNLMFLKTKAAIDMNKKEKAVYEESLVAVKAKTEAAKSDIITAREELEKAKILRERKSEYDALARVIRRHPDRENTERELAVLEAEIQKLENTKRQYFDMMDEREKMCRNLIFSAAQLRRLMEEQQVAVVDTPERLPQPTMLPPVIDLEGLAEPPTTMEVDPSPSENSSNAQS